MQVRHFMTPVVVLLHPDRTVKEAAERMSELNIGVLPIGEADKVIGILTDRDIVIRSVASGHDPLMERVRDVMTPEVIYCFDDQDVEEAQQLMERNRIRRLVVRNRQGQLVGMLSLADMWIADRDLTEANAPVATGLSIPVAIVDRDDCDSAGDDSR